MIGLLPFLRVDEVYSVLPPEDRPLITKMGISTDKPLVHSVFGLVQRGSVLSYQQPKRESRSIEVHQHAPPPPCLPLLSHQLSPTDCIWVCTEEEQLHLQTLQLAMEMSHNIYSSTRV